MCKEPTLFQRNVYLNKAIFYTNRLVFNVTAKKKISVQCKAHEISGEN
jgi:hypothetical protein